MRRFALFILVIGLGAVGVAFGATRAKGHTSAVHHATAPSTTVTTTEPSVVTTNPKAAPLPVSAPCKASNVTVFAYRGSGAGGEKSVVVVVSNLGPSSCTIQGYPTAWFVDAAGVRLGPESMAPDLSREPPGRIIELAPGEIASTNLWTPDPTFGPPVHCTPATTSAVHISLPGDAGAGRTAAMRTLVCTTNHFVRTTPFMAGDVPAY